MKNNFKNIELTNRNHKTWKTIYKYTLLKNYLLKNNILIFYYDFLNKEDQNSLQLILKTYKLKSIKIKKNSTLNFLNNLEYIHLKNIFKNNIIIITSTSNEFFFNQNTLNIFENIKSIYFIGAWLNLKLYRPSEYKQLLNLKKDSIKTPVILLKNIINVLKTKITFLKK
jgi:hypothetical protein